MIVTDLDLSGRSAKSRREVRTLVHNDGATECSAPPITVKPS
jgi:hypothetical protein